MVVARKTLETDRELDVARTDNVLDLEVAELGIEAELLDDTGVLAGSKLAVVFTFGTRHDHLAGSEDQSRSLGLTDTHDDGGETLGIVLGVSGVQGNGLEVQAGRQVHGGDDVLQSWHDARRVRVGIGGVCGSGHAVDLCVTHGVLLRGRRGQLSSAVGIGQASRRGELRSC